jgi:hypothetical protein
MKTLLANLFTPTRLLVFALAGSAASFGLKAAGALNPGLPQSQVEITNRVPFFEHMILAAFIGLLAWVGGAKLEPFVRAYPRAVLALIVSTTIGAGLIQWFFPNFF